MERVDLKFGKLGYLCDLEVPKGKRLRKIIWQVGNIVFYEYDDLPKQKQLYEYANDYFKEFYKNNDHFIKGINTGWFPFAYLCGILKLVCDDCGVTFSDFMYNTMRYGGSNGNGVFNTGNRFTEQISKVIKICGDEFLSKIYNK